MKRLVAHLRVFFDKRSGKAERIEQFIAERGIEYGLQFVTLFFLNPPDCLYTKKSREFLQSYEKSRYSSKIIGKILLCVCNYPCLTVEGAYRGGQRVVVVEATVVAVGRDAVNGVHRVNIPRGKYE